MLKLLYILFSALFISTSFKKNPLNIGYDFSKPNVNIVLPSSLQEISGITIIDSNTVACVQDEEGILFLYDIHQFRIRKEIYFGIKGDYEGVTKANNTIYILRSDGTIFEMKDYTSNNLQVKEFKTGIPSINHEGLCYDILNKRLLISSKGKINDDPINRDKRFIYEFDLKTKTLNQIPVFNFNTNDINLSAKLEEIPFRKKKDKKGVISDIIFKLHISDIAIHPITNQLYVLSATDYCLFIFNMSGIIDRIQPLDPILFNQAEGLSFFPNGDLLISNEGQAHQPTLLRFNYHPN
jgi:hypothetical protein